MADLLLDKDVLPKLGGVITLTDLYCLVNRTRGTELLSPTDFSAACELINSLNLENIKHKTYPSGVKVIISSELSDDIIQRRLLELIEERFRNGSPQGMHPGEVAQVLNLSIGA